MKKILILLLFIVALSSCDTDYINDPDNPVSAPTTQILNNAQYDLAYELNDQWVAGRGTLTLAQYWAQTTYTDEDRYQFRGSQVDDMWEWPYRVLTDLKKVIDINDDNDTKDSASAYGDNNNQIQASRIMMSYTFLKLVDTFGDVPYWSYGQKSNPKFQGLKLSEGINSPAYTEAKTIYEDILAELLDAANKMNVSKTVFTSGDNIYNGDAQKWIKFAHSLRLRVAAHLNKVDPSAAKKAFSESDSKAFSSNDDNASFTFGDSDIVGGPWDDAFKSRRDFAPALSFTDLLKDKKDPRIDKYFDKRLDSKEVIGLPYGFGDAAARAIKNESVPSSTITKADYTQYFLEYSEIEFIRAEFNGWAKANYENGVKASMEKWEVPQADIDTYVSSLPAPSEENVITQKYIALYMYGLESWTEYRRTGFPNTLSVPGDTFKGDTFKTAVSGLTVIPTRITYPQNEQLLNKSNWSTASKKLKKGDKLDSKLFWDVN